MKSFLVVGLGHFGYSAATALEAHGHRVTALDVDRDKVEAAGKRLRRAVVGDATDPEVLEQVGAADHDAAIVSTGGDVSASLLTAMGLRDFGVRPIHVKVVSELHARILDKMGIPDTVFPEHETARLLAHRIASASILRYFELGPGFSAQELAVPASWVGRSLRDLALPRRHRVSVIAVRDYLVDEMQPVPDPDAPLKDSDTLLLAGRGPDLERVARIGDAD